MYVAFNGKVSVIVLGSWSRTKGYEKNMSIKGNNIQGHKFFSHYIKGKSWPYVLLSVMTVINFKNKLMVITLKSCQLFFYNIMPINYSIFHWH